MGKRKEYDGIVVGDKMQKTVVVRVMRHAKHPKNGKVMKHYNKFKAHDESGACKVGDEVRIAETRPISKDKHFRVIKMLKKAHIVAVELPSEEIK